MSLVIYKIVALISPADKTFLGPLGPILAFLVLLGLVYLLVRPYREADKKTVKIK